MELRIIVDSTREPPKFGELTLLVGEGGEDGRVSMTKACFQSRVVIEKDIYGNDVYSEWTEVPMVLHSQKLAREASEKATRGRIVRIADLDNIS